MTATAQDGAAGDRRRHWQGVYEAKDPSSVSWFQATPTLSLALIEAAGIRPEASIVDIGGGASTLVDFLLDRGFQSVTVLDVAEAALKESRRRLGAKGERVVWAVADVVAWRPGARYDLWHDRAVFHFLTAADDRRAYRDALQAALRPGGQAIIATFALDGPERCSGLPVVRYGPETLAAELGDRFELIETRSEDHVTPQGRHQSFQYCRFVKRT